MEIRPAPRVALGAVDTSNKYLTGDCNIFWTAQELEEYIFAVRSKVIVPPKIRRQKPKPSRTHHINKQVYAGKENVASEG